MVRPAGPGEDAGAGARTHSRCGRQGAADADDAGAPQGGRQHGGAAERAAVRGIHQVGTRALGRRGTQGQTESGLNMNAAIDTIAPLTESELLDLGSRAFRGLGLPAQDAQQVARILVLADLFGLTTHGLSRIESYGDRLNVGGIARAPRITVQKVAPALVKVDGDNGVGPLVGMRALEAAMAAARECGV